MANANAVEGEGAAAAAAAEPAPVNLAVAARSMPISYDFDASNTLQIHAGESSYVMPSGITFGKTIREIGFTRRTLGSGMSGDTWLLNYDGFEPDRLVLKNVTRLDMVPRKSIEREINFLSLVKGKWWAVQLLTAQIMPSGQAMLLFPYVPGKELFEIIKDYEDRKPGHLPLPRIRAIFQDVLEGLKELHTLGVIHRDIKPENIWVPDDPSKRPFLLDFGLAGKTTETLRTAGTPQYIRDSRKPQARNPTPNDNFFALGKSASYIDFFATPLYKRFMKDGLTGADIDFAFAGGRRLSHTRRGRKYRRRNKNTRKSK